MLSGCCASGMTILALYTLAMLEERYSASAGGLIRGTLYYVCVLQFWPAGETNILKPDEYLCVE